MNLGIDSSVKKFMLPRLHLLIFFTKLYSKCLGWTYAPHQNENHDKLDLHTPGSSPFVKYQGESNQQSIILTHSCVNATSKSNSFTSWDLISP